MVTQRVELPETTALYRAALAYYIETAHVILTHGADPNTRSKEGVKLLRKLVDKGSVRMTRLLLEYDADVNSHGALRAAARIGSFDVVRLLIRYDAEIDGKNETGEIPLYYASWKGHERVVAILLRESADPNVRIVEGQSALYKAAGQGHSEVVQILLLYGADPKISVGQAGETVLYKASRLGHERTVKLLLRRGANPDVENEFGKSDYGSKNQLLMQVLRPTERVQNEFGQRPLHAGARLGHLSIAQLRLDYGADVNTRPQEGKPAVYIAADMGHKDMVDLLLKFGAQLLDVRFVDPVARMMQNDSHEQILGVDEKAGSSIAQNDPTSTLLSRFKKESLAEGGHGLKTLSRLLDLSNTQKSSRETNVTRGFMLASAAGAMTKSGLSQRSR